MKTELPDALKAAAPQTPWGKVLVVTPVVMTIVATMLAGLSTSEMTRAQYARSLAAQLQSKAGDQWGFFQAKRLRGAIQRSTLDVLQGTVAVRALDETALRQLGDLDATTTAALTRGELPPITALAVDAKLQAALDAVEGATPEAEIAAALTALKDIELAAGVKAARDRALDLDVALRPVNEAIERVEQALATAPPGDLARSFASARLRYTAARYDAEARLNQAIANLYELQVRKANLAAERHHRRSLRFFFGMLAAQAAVIVSTFSLAAQKRSFLWSLAAAAGAGAVAFAIYVYLCV